jgi:hypothetical protein
MGLPPNNAASKVLDSVAQIYTVDFVTVRILHPDDNCELEAWSYGPDEMNEVHKEDYISALCDDRDRLIESQRREPSREIAKKIDALQAEINRLSVH